MKLVGGLIREIKIKGLVEWQDWFAWHPVRVGITAYGHRRKVWLEKVQRKGIRKCEANGRGGSFEYWVWLYREIGAKDLK
jgi:hypothetical protein